MRDRIYKVYKSLEDEMKACEHGYKGNLSPHHEEGSVYNHMNLVMEEIKKIDKYNQYLNIAGLFHDVGKIFTREEDDERKKTTFINHHLYSVNWVRSNLYSILYETLSEQEIFYIYQLIQYHMFSNTRKIVLENMKNNLLGSFDTYIKLLKADSRGRIFSSKNKEDGLQTIIDYNYYPKSTSTYKHFIVVDDNEDLLKSVAGMYDSWDGWDGDILFMPIGSPASGKTTVKNLLSDHFEVNNICFDDIRLKLYKDLYPSESENSDKIYAKAFKYCKDNKIDLMKYVHRIFKNRPKKKAIHYIDNTNLSYKSRSKFRNLKKGSLKIGYYMDLPLQLHLDRNKARKENDKFVPEEIVKSMYYRTELPSFSEFDIIIYQRIEK